MISPLFLLRDRAAEACRRGLIFPTQVPGFDSLGRALESGRLLSLTLGDERVRSLGCFPLGDSRFPFCGLFVGGAFSRDHHLCDDVGNTHYFPFLVSTANNL